MPRLSSSCINQIIHDAFLFITIIDGQTLTQSHPLTACSHRLSSILTALPFTPQIKSPHIFFTLSVRNMAILFVAATSLREYYLPPETRAVPRHLRAEKTRFFVHARIPDGSAATRAGRAKSRSKKLCKFVHFVQVSMPIYLTVACL